MKNVKTVTVRKITVQLNSTNAKSDRWARIRDAHTGAILHTGRVGYIKAVAKKRYNRLVKV